jgi:hypothetical protein
MRDSKSIALASALESEQPTAKSLLDRMEGITNDSLRELLYLRVEVIMERYLKTGVRMYFAFEQISTYHESGTCDTNLHAVSRTTRIKRRGDANCTLAPDNSNFYHPSVFKDLEF